MLPKPGHLSLHFFLDEGVPDAVGRVLEERGHTVTFGNKALARGSPDQVVCVAALHAGAILVAADHDMKSIARANGVPNQRFKFLSLIKLSCRNPEAAEKVRQTMFLIEHEWECGMDDRRRRIWIEIQPTVVKIIREQS